MTDSKVAAVPVRGLEELRMTITELRSTLYTTFNDYKDDDTIRGRFAKACPWLSAHSIERIVEVFCDELEAALVPCPAVASPECVCGHGPDAHGNNGTGHCGEARCRRGGCKKFTPAVRPQENK
jgi:hypothetical protein